MKNKLKDLIKRANHHEKYDKTMLTSQKYPSMNG